MMRDRKMWQNYINSIFQLFLGLLAGIAMMMMVFVINQQEQATFIKSYNTFANLICIFQQISCNMALIFSMTLCLIYKQKADLDNYRGAENRKASNDLYIMSCLITFMISVPWLLLQLEPKYSNMIHYYQASKFEKADFQTFQIINYVKNGFLIATWFVSSVQNKSIIGEMDLDEDSR